MHSTSLDNLQYELRNAYALEDSGSAAYLVARSAPQAQGIEPAFLKRKRAPQSKAPTQTATVVLARCCLKKLLGSVSALEQQWHSRRRPKLGAQRSFLRCGVNDWFGSNPLVPVKVRFPGAKFEPGMSD